MNNTPDREEPRELTELKKRSPVYLTALNKDAKPKFERIDKDGTWVLEMGNEFMVSWEDGFYWTKCGYPGAVANANRPSRIQFPDSGRRL